LTVDRIKHAVNSVLAARGWTLVDSGANVAVLAMEITRDQQTLDTFYDGFGGGWGWRRFGQEPQRERQQNVQALSSRRYYKVGARMWVAIVLTNTKEVSAKSWA
jgi:hypothetical protein